MRVGEQSAPAVTPDRQRASQVQAATQAWTGQLIDLGGRNTLLFYRDLKLGTLDLAAGDSVVLAASFEGRTVALSHLVTDEEAFGQARRRAPTIRKARELVEERGIETLAGRDPADGPCLAPPLRDRVHVAVVGRVRV